MSLVAIRSKSQLEETLVLVPERYDPRRGFLLACRATVCVGDLARLVRQSLNPSQHGRDRYLVLDTSDAREGLVTCRKSPVPASALGSVKKSVEVGDVLISRLRPYLRQVAFVDRAIGHGERDVALACSTEFYVLRSVDSRSIAFLVPLLLCDAVQEVLAASQEGGHHPRFGEEVLLALPIPQDVLEHRESHSRSVLRSIGLYRASEARLRGLVNECQSELVRGTSKRLHL